MSFQAELITDALTDFDLVHEQKQCHPASFAVLLPVIF